MHTPFSRLVALGLVPCLSAGSFLATAVSKQQSFCLLANFAPPATDAEPSASMIRKEMYLDEFRQTAMAERSLLGNPDRTMSPVLVAQRAEIFREAAEQGGLSPGAEMTESDALGRPDSLAVRGIEARRMFASHMPDLRKNDITDQLRQRTVEILTDFLAISKNIPDDRRGALQQRLNDLREGRFHIYGFYGIVSSKDDFIYQCSHPNAKELFLATDFFRYMQEGGFVDFPSVSEEFVLYSFIVDILGERETRILLERYYHHYPRTINYPRNPTLDSDGLPEGKLTVQLGGASRHPEKLGTPVAMAVEEEPPADPKWPSDNEITTLQDRQYSTSITIDPNWTADVENRALMELMMHRGVTIHSVDRDFKFGSFAHIVKVTTNLGELIMEMPIGDDRASLGASKSRLSTILNSHINRSYFWAKGLRRFIPEPKSLIELNSPEGPIPVAFMSFIAKHREANWGNDTLRLWDENGVEPIPKEEIPNALVEIAAVLAYHYEPDEGGGTTLSDVFINNGDFIGLRFHGGSIDFKIITMRNRRKNVSPRAFIRSLIELAAFESMSPDHEKLYGGMEAITNAIPLRVSNPSIAFAGLVRGLEYRYSDLNKMNPGSYADPEDTARRQAVKWISDFAGSNEGETYREEARKFLAGELSPHFGQAPEEGVPNRTRMRDLLKLLHEALGEGALLGTPLEGMVRSSIEFVNNRLSGQKRIFQPWGPGQHSQTRFLVTSA